LSVAEGLGQLAALLFAEATDPAHLGDAGPVPVPRRPWPGRTRAAPSPMRP